MRVKKSVDRLPSHLKPFVVEQAANLYTPIDHAGWRFIMRVSRDFFKEHAHQKYLDGLVETGIETERIPRIDEIDLCLSQFGWGAVPVSGFIPPGVFMELLSMGILPIAADMRKVEHLEYTPAPDIVHEAAGHAPILADLEYAKFLHDCGEIARKCIISRKDMNQYEAILDLSNIKEDPKSTKEQIAAAEKKLQEAIAANDFVSEATQFGRMIWWTIEYGLVGDLKKPKIYGAGLLSSVAESFHCLSDKVKKLPFNLECINYSYDITEPQPQLFVTPDFPTLSTVARQFSETLAYKRGGIMALDKAVQSENTTTTVLDSGLQISGTLAKYSKDRDGEACYLQFSGPSQLAVNDQELPGHGVSYHAQGFGTPVGKLKGLGKSAHLLTDQDLINHYWQVGQRVKLEFESGVVVEGVLKGTLRSPVDSKPLVVMTFDQCKVTQGSDVLFRPEWGPFDMGCGETVVSVFGGAADRPRFTAGDYSRYRSKAPVSNLTPQNKNLNELYALVRALRESKKGAALSDGDRKKLETVMERLDKEYPQDWLLKLEMLELEPTGPLAPTLRKKLADVCATSKVINELVTRGLKIV